MEMEAKVEALRLRRLRCSAQRYDWGRVGEESAVARLYSRNSASEVDSERPYAEFWMGTHESGPSFVLAGAGEPEAPPPPPEGDVPLKSWITENPEVLGEKVAEKWGGDLPFLFKVLSVAKALSIQAHPDRELAAVLHEQKPSVYKDSNHKPEMALALTEFKALCGFVSLEEFKDLLIKVPEIAELVGSDEITKVLNIKEHDGEEKVKALLQSFFTKVMSASEEIVSDLVSKLKARLTTENKVRMLTEKEELALVLEKQYPSDVGVLSSFFFNYVKLNPGEALYLGANEPHAYLSGDCIECMATSDNVVRAGLTPKYRDVQTLCSMLTYRLGSPEILRGITLSPYLSRYTPPFDEFEVDRCLLPAGESVIFSAVAGPSLFVAMAGEGSIHVRSSIVEEEVVEGHVFFVPAKTEICLTAGSAGELHLYRAGVNSTFFEN